MISCDQTKIPNKVFGDIIHETEKGYQFQDFNWWIDQKTIEKEVPNTSYDEALDRIETRETYGKVETKIFYLFEDHLFCSGEYLFILESESDFDKVLAKVKEQAGSYLTREPMSNSLQSLSIDQDVTWEGEDKSYFRIRCLEKDSQYVISLKVEAPKERQELE